MSDLIDTVVCGDAVIELKKLKSDYVHLVVTSPPFYNARRYCFFNRREIGQSDYSSYLIDLNKVWTECCRVLKPDGKLVIDIGEIFLRERPKQVVIYTHIFLDIIQQIEKQKTMHFFGKILWCKGTSNLNAGFRRTKFIFGSYPYPPNMLVTNATENLLIFRKKGKRPRPPDHILKQSKLTIDFAREFTRPIWFIMPRAKKDHPAVFPGEIPKRFIKAFTYVGDTVLDPFSGRGTALIEAKKLKRHYIGIELSSNYVDLSKKLLKEEP